MTVEQYFELLGYDHHSSEQFFFVRAKAFKEDKSDRYECWYKETPVRGIYEWWGCDSIMDAIVLNHEAYAPEQIGIYWNAKVKNGGYKALLIISQEDYDKLHFASIEWIDKTIREAVKDEIGKHATPRRAGQIESVHCKEEPRMMKLIRKFLIRDGKVKVHNNYETFYGVGFDRWLREGLADIPCEIEVLTYNKWEGYPWSYNIIKK